MGDVVEDVEACDALLREEARRLGLRLLQDRREEVALPHLAAPRALDVQHRRLQHAAEGERLLGLAALPAGHAVDAVLEDVLEGHAQRAEIGATDAGHRCPEKKETEYLSG